MLPYIHIFTYPNTRSHQLYPGVRSYSGHRSELDPVLGLEVSRTNKPRGLTVTSEASRHLLFPTTGVTVDSLELWQSHNTSCSHTFHGTLSDPSLPTWSKYPYSRLGRQAEWMFGSLLSWKSGGLKVLLPLFL